MSTLIRQLAERLYRKVCPVVTHHTDIRIYASAAMQRGDDHLHYGYWERGTDDLRCAQDNLYSLVRTLIDNNTRTILDVGGGIGGTSNRLMQDGYDPLCIVPDAALISMGKQRFPRVRFLRGSAERFRVRGTYDAAIMLESYQYFSDRQQAVSNIVRHLTNHGSIIVADEFALPSDPIVGMPKEEELLVQMYAHNYDLVTRSDITNQVLPTCRSVYEGFAQHIGPLAEQWRTTEKIYMSGSRCYLLLLFQARMT